MNKEMESVKKSVINSEIGRENPMHVCVYIYMKSMNNKIS